ncbi:MAG: GNAT family N-acetyltransferase [Thermomicrobiales bacterium]
MERTPQRATGFDFTVVNVPDFFARARLYEQATVFIVEEHGRIAGSAACAIRDVLIDGRPYRVAYEFQYFTAAQYQGRGVARQLHAHIEDHLIRHGVELTTAITSDNNQASIRLFEGHGFLRHRALDLHLVAVVPHIDMRSDLPIRRATAGDLPAVARLINLTWGRHDLFAPTSPDELSAQIERALGQAPGDVLVLEEGGDIVACAGVWDWGGVQQLRITAVEPSNSSTPAFGALVPGQTLRQWGLTAVGFRRPEQLATLLRCVTNRALDQSVAHVGLLSEPGHPSARVVEGFAQVVTPVRFYAKQLHPHATLGDRPLFVDMTDI